MSGGCCRDMMNPPNKGACSMYMMDRNRQMWMNWNRQMRGACFLIDDESESRNAGGYLRFSMNRNRQMRGRVEDTGGTGIAK